MHLPANLRLGPLAVYQRCDDEDVEEAGDVQVDDRGDNEAPAHLAVWVVKCEQADAEKEENQLLSADCNRLIA